MFQAGVVAPSSVFLLQLLVLPGGELGIPPLTDEVESEDLVGLRRPPFLNGRVGVAALPALELLIPLGLE